MALLDDVKSELAAIDNELPAAKKAQATAMIRFGGGLRLVQRQIIVQAQFDSLEAAKWLQSTIKNLYGHEASLAQVARQTPSGVVQRYLVQVERGGAALALQTGLLDRRKHLVLGLPADIISGNIAQVKAAWRGAFLAHGGLSDPGKASYLEIVCPTNEAALALVGAARRRARDAEGSGRHRTHAHAHGRPALRAGVDRQAFRRRGPGQGQPPGQFRRRQHAPQRQGGGGGQRQGA